MEIYYLSDAPDKPVTDYGSGTELVAIIVCAVVGGVGLIFLVILPVILGLVLWITGSSKIVFLIIWILCMFALCAYLISVEYLDDSMQRPVDGLTAFRLPVCRRS